MKHLLTLLLCWTVLVEKPIRVIDGDTFVTEVAIWHDLRAVERVRLFAVDAHEMKKDTLVKGTLAKNFTIAWLAQGPFTLATCYKDSFGRILATVKRGDDDLADKLRKAGHAK